MTSVKRLENQIWKLERIEAQVLRSDGRKLRSDRGGLPSWPYRRAAKDDWTVRTWTRERFRSKYPGFKVAVFNGDRAQVHGGTKLKTVRRSFSE